MHGLPEYPPNCLLMLRIIWFGLCICLMNVRVGLAQDCRLKVEDLTPIIQRYNPFFIQHTWDPSGQIEMARMGEERLLMITQDGCIRHHITFNLIIEDKICRGDKAFWVEEVQNFLHKAYWEQEDYTLFGQEFDTTFAQKFDMYGFGRGFNFPIGTRNFICQVDYEPGKGGRIRIEMVVYVFKEQVRTQPEPNDDAQARQGNPRNR